MTLPRFSIPTLVTITGPTCSGKNFLLDELIKQFEFNRIVSTTDRKPRAGEVQGVQYDFISTKRSKEIETQDKFAELITHNDVRYGVTRAELELKLNGATPPVVILEPKGVEAYRKYCQANNWSLFSIFVATPQTIELERLAERTTQNILNDDRLKVLEHITRHNSRLKSIINEESFWQQSRTWDLTVYGQDAKLSLTLIKNKIDARNNWIAEYVTTKFNTITS